MTGNNVHHFATPYAIHIFETHYAIHILSIVKIKTTVTNLHKWMCYLYWCNQTLTAIQMLCTPRTKINSNKCVNMNVLPVFLLSNSNKYTHIEQTYYMHFKKRRRLIWMSFVLMWSILQLIHTLNIAIFRTLQVHKIDFAPCTDPIQHT